jgi:hypothetical protein
MSHTTQGMVKEQDALNQSGNSKWKGKDGYHWVQVFIIFII